MTASSSGADDMAESSYIVALIQDLALSRSDCLSAQNRDDLVKIVADFLTEKASTRRAFADHGGTLREV